MKITPCNTARALTSINTTEAAQTKATEKPAVQATAAIDPVLGEAQRQMATLPDVDMARVIEIKEAISSGKVTIQLDQLSDAIQKYFKG